MKNGKCYMIQNKAGLYSGGGAYPRFTKQGKIWTNIGHVKSHLGVVGLDGRRRYKDCKIIVVEITATEEISMDAFMEEVVEKHRIAEQRSRLMYEARRKRLMGE